MSESKISFAVDGFDCTQCTPIFKKGLQRVRGVKKVNQQVLMNEVVVEYDEDTISADRLKDEIMHVAFRVGWKGKVSFVLPPKDS